MPHLAEIHQNLGNIAESTKDLARYHNIKTDADPTQLTSLEHVEARLATMAQAGEKSTKVENNRIKASARRTEAHAVLLGNRCRNEQLLMRQELRRLKTQQNHSMFMMSAKEQLEDIKNIQGTAVHQHRAIIEQERAGYTAFHNAFQTSVSDLAGILTDY